VGLVGRGSSGVQGTILHAPTARGSVGPPRITLLTSFGSRLTFEGIACVYEPKQKPGLKAGAVEALTRRVGGFENDHYFLGLNRSSIPRGNNTG
jgi:hypothetical protein